MQVISLFLVAVDLISALKAGFEIPVANEFDPTIYETFKVNHPKTKLIEGDIRKISEDDFPKEIDGVLAVLPANHGRKQVHYAVLKTSAVSCSAEAI